MKNIKVKLSNLLLIIWMFCFLVVLLIQIWQFAVEIHIINLESVIYWMFLPGIITATIRFKLQAGYFLWLALVHYSVASFLFLLGAVQLSEIIFKLSSILMLSGLIGQLGYAKISRE